MAQNDELSNTLLNVERAVNTLLPEIQSEISDLAARMGSLTDPQAQDLIDRMNALNAKVSNAVTALQADNPATPPPAGGASAHTRERDR